MLKIKKFFYFNSLSLRQLKSRIQIVYSLKRRLNVFFKQNYYLLFGGMKFSFLRINVIHVGSKFSQFIFTKKPFSGPIKKFKL